MGYRKGDNVVSARNIGGALRAFVPAGTKGVVLQGGGWGQQALVRFKVGGLGNPNTTVDVRVADDELL